VRSLDVRHQNLQKSGKGKLFSSSGSQSQGQAMILEQNGFKKKKH
jgi:hypothetical protein